MNNFYVYLHYRKDTLQPFYVGKGSGRRIDSKKSRNKYWHNIVNKHGLFAQIMESNLTEEQAFEREMFYISILGKENLCNMTDGGDGTSGYKHSDEAKNKLREKNIGKKQSDETKTKRSVALTGKKRKSPSDKIKKQISDALKGKNSPFYGKKGIESHMFGRKLPEEVKQKIGRSGVENKSSKKVININTNEIFDCIKEAAQKNNILTNNLARYLRGERKNKTPFRYYEKTP